MIIFTLKRAHITLLKINSSPDYKGMSSRALTEKVENRPELKIIKIALKLNPLIQDPKKVHGDAIKTFADQIEAFRALIYAIQLHVC